MSDKKRECDGCTKCCDGSLSGSAHGHSFYLGKPCFFVILDKGCTIHKERPTHPCKSFECLWITNNDVPEEFKPSLSNMIAYETDDAGVDHITIHDVGDSYSKNVLDWWKEYAKNKNLNISWRMQRENNTGWQGSKDFCKSLNKYYN